MQLQTVLNETLTRDVMIQGDFSLQVGKDDDTWVSVLMNFGIGQKNRNGQQLLKFTAANDMVIAHSLFPHVKTISRADTAHMVSLGLL